MDKEFQVQIHVENHSGFMRACQDSGCKEYILNYMPGPQELFIVLCIPRDFCDPAAFGPFATRSDAMIFLNKPCVDKHKIIVLRNPE